jgi:hypothetical protein
MGQDSIQHLVLRVVRHRILFDAPQTLVDEIISDANLACLEAPKTPDDMEKAPAWVAGVTANVVKTYFRRNTKHLRWLNREANVEEVAAEELAPPVLEAADDTSMLDSIDAWLDKVVARNPKDKQTLEIIRHKARTKQTDPQVVAHFGLSSVSALESRVHYFKTKYQDRRQRWLSQRNRTIALLWKITLWTAAAIVLAIVVWRMVQGRRQGGLLPGFPASESPLGRDEGPPVSHPAPPDLEEKEQHPDAGSD